MEDYRDKFNKLYQKYRRTFGLTISSYESWTEITLKVIYCDRTIISIHEKTDRPLRCEPGYEDDHEESEILLQTGYYKAHNALKHWLNDRFRGMGLKEI